MRIRTSLSGNLTAKSSAAFSRAAGSALADAAFHASYSGCVLVCGGRLGAGAAAVPGAVWAPAGGFWGCPLFWAADQLAMLSNAITIAAGFMLSPRLCNSHAILKKIKSTVAAGAWAARTVARFHARPLPSLLES